MRAFGFRPALVGGLGGGEHDRRGAVVEAAGVAGGDPAVLAERGPQLGEGLGGGRLRMLVGGEADGLALHLDLDRHDLAGEAAAGDRRRGAGLALSAKARGRLRSVVVLRLLAAFAVFAVFPLLLALAAPAAGLEQRLIAADGAANSLMGVTSAVEGDTAVIGAPGADGSEGAVYVFTRVGDTWAQSAKLTASTGLPGDALGGSVAIDGDTIVAGARGDDIAGDGGRGSLYTFARSGLAARNETAKLTASDGDADDRLGSSVAIDGDTIVGGAPGDAISGEDNRGSAYTFARTGAGTRTQTAKLRAADGDANDRLGSAVAIEGDTIVAGAPADDVGVNDDQGSAYTFTRTGAPSRTHTARLTAGDGAAVDELGLSIAIASDTIVAGMPADDIGGVPARGSVLTFTRSGAAARNETAKLTASDGASGDSLGWSVAVAGETILAGAPFDQVGLTTAQGSAYIFSRTGAGSRTEAGALRAADAATGDATAGSVATDGSTVVAGAQWDDVGGVANQGSAVVFFAPAGAPPGTGPGGTGGGPGGGRPRRGPWCAASTSPPTASPSAAAAPPWPRWPAAGASPSASPPPPR